jgi:hypothetical protein
MVPLHRSLLLDPQVVDALVALNGEQDADGLTDGGHASYAGMGLDALQTVPVVAQGRLVQAEGFDQVDQRPTQVDIADLGHVLTLAFLLAGARIIAPADQAGASEDLGGIVVMTGVAHGGHEAGDLDGADTFEAGPDVTGGQA